MNNTNAKIKSYTQPSKKYHKRYYKILSIIAYYQKNAIKYNQTTILKALNTFLVKDGLKPITLRTLRKDLALLCNKGIIQKTLLRLGEGNGSYIRYSVNKYSLHNLKKLLKAKDAIVEHDANAIYNFTKKTQQKYCEENGIKIFKRKSATKNVSQYINSNKKIINKKKKKEKTKKEAKVKTQDTNFSIKGKEILIKKRKVEETKKEEKEKNAIKETNEINLLIKNVGKWKTMRYLDKVEENANKKRYEESMRKTREWLKKF
ncbi:plasmid maintenance protein [Borrelia persica]|uniref:plasmid maintenance protein n=1 Tax=Borrelia persica TaxID=44448 RepID=UPI00046551AD|nr:plasmid maintenance protein [Borrelia persica]